MRSRQRGATALGMLCIVAIIGFALYGGIRLFPVYMEYLAVARAMDQTSEELGGNPTSPQALRVSLDRRWTIEDIKSLQPKDIEIKKNGTGWSMRAWYRAETPFVANISLAVDFDKTVDVKGP
jgi:hypothetical protein